ncbi:MAG: hypothetical protein PHX43_08580, partial [Alphaproteobacteria bacterium]|nr:hypothetical protein [Alphaproteobacteria bacterium]
LFIFDETKGCTMIFPKEYGEDILKITKPIWESDLPEHLRLYNLCLSLNYTQGVLLSGLIRARIGNKVYGGPFKGMTLIPEAMNNLYAPSLLGTYEHELHEIVERIIATPYKQILNIGCSFGYYSIGLALRMPNTKIYSFDIDPSAREKCLKMASVNGVTDQVVINGLFPGEDFAKYAGSETLVLMDIEGAETELLNPELYPALKGMDVLIELHDCIAPNISKIITERFSATHNIEIVKNRPKAFPLHEIFGEYQYIEHMDGMIATWEGRVGPTPWAFMTRKK